MSTLTTINATDKVSDSRAVINTNFSTLNTDKAETASPTLTTPTLTSPVLNTGVSGTAFLDEDDMASNSATKLASQQSIKAYVDAKTWGASSLTNRTRNISLNLGDFNAGTGSPVIGSANGGNAYAWLLDASGTEDIFTNLILPEDLVTGNITLKAYWSMETATSGSVVLTAQASGLRDGSAIDSIATLLSHQQTVAVPGVADTVKVTSFNTFTGTAGDGLRIRFIRLGGEGADDAAGDMCLYAIELEYTADM